MTKEEFLQKIKEIEKVDEEAKKASLAHQLTLAKPPWSLGGLEDITVRLAGIKGSNDYQVNKCMLFVFASDNGVCCEGVSSCPQSITWSQTINLTLKKTGAATLCAYFGDDILVTDVGVIGNTDNGKVVQKKIRESTSNIKIGPAMTEEECIKALSIGFETALKYKDTHDLFGIGEMGIGNTTTSSAVLSVLTSLPVEQVTGKGAGLVEEAYLNKINVIKEAISVNKPNQLDPIDVLQKVGGFDLAAMTGAYLGCAYAKRPVVIDGLISVVAALTAFRLCENAAGYFFPSHASYEIGYRKAIEELHLTPFLNLGMRLGEGSGCPLAFEIIKASIAIRDKMATFDEASINDDYLEEIRIGDKFKV